MNIGSDEKISAAVGPIIAGRHAERHEDWPEALRRWTLVKDRFNNVLGPGGMANSLGRLADAEEVATETRDRFPNGDNVEARTHEAEAIALASAAEPASVSTESMRQRAIPSGDQGNPDA